MRILSALFSFCFCAFVVQSASADAKSTHRLRETVLYAFPGGTGGMNPAAPLLIDRRGALFGTAAGGTGSCGSYSCGIVYELAPAGSQFVEKTLYDFQGGTDGAGPSGALIARKGALYGETSAGGSDVCEFTCGTVFKLTPSGSSYTESVIYRFRGGTDGAGPQGGLVADKDGNLYGTTNLGGGYGKLGSGTVFKLTPHGSGYTETVLYRFQGGSDGAYPAAGLIVDKGGALYGTTEFGGDGVGVVFKLTPAGTGFTETILHTFVESDGAYPTSKLVSDRYGRFFGTTYLSSEHSARCGECGTVYMLTPTNSGYLEYVLMTFDMHDGAFPSAGLTFDSAGNLYGTTDGGGVQRCRRRYGCGVAFELIPGFFSEFSYAPVHKFQGGNEGGEPMATLALDAHGVLYGTTITGGGSAACSMGCGTVFALK